MDHERVAAIGDSTMLMPPASGDRALQESPHIDGVADRDQLRTARWRWRLHIHG
jgi:hypothetical protein